MSKVKYRVREYFPDLDDQQPIEVYVSAKRVVKEN